MSLAINVKLNRNLALLPLLEVAYNTTPLRLAMHTKGILVVGRRVWLEAEDLDASTRRLMHDDTSTHNTCVVKDEHGRLREVVGNVRKPTLRNLAIVIYHEFRLRTLRKRKLGDAAVRKVVVVVVYIYMSLNTLHIYSLIRYSDSFCFHSSGISTVC